MSYYPEPENNIKDKVKVVLDLSSYVTRKELENRLQTTGFDTSNLATKKGFRCFLT